MARSFHSSARLRDGTLTESDHGAPAETRNRGQILSPYAISTGLGLAAGALYFATAARTITWLHDGTDGAELSTAAYVLGVPHPTGYPLYILLAHLFTLLPVGEVAFRVGLISILAAATGVVLASLLAWRLIVAPASARLVGAAMTGALLAVAPLYWVQGTIAETYSLNAAFNLGALLLLALWRPGDDRYVVGMGLLAGLSLAHHTTSILLIAPIVVVGLVRDPGVVRRRACIVSIGLVTAGLLLYLYLPIRALANPAMDWNDPRDLGGFLAEVTARMYQPYLTSTGPLDDLPRIPVMVRLLAANLTWPGLALAILGLGELLQRQRAYGWALIAIMFANAAFAIQYHVAYGERYFLPVVVVLAVAAGIGAASLSNARAARRALVGLIAILATWQIAMNWPAMNISGDRTAANFARSELLAAQPGGIVHSASDAHTFALWYVQTVEGVRPDVAVLDARFLNQPWYRTAVGRRNPQLLERLDEAASEGLATSQ